MTGRARARVIAIASGKGGVGKTSLAVNVAVALSKLGRRVGVLDGDFGLGNVDVLLGLTPIVHLGHLLDGERSLQEITLEGPAGVSIIPSGSGIPKLTALTSVQRGRLKAAVEQLCGLLDFLIVDTASGISDNVIETIALADKALLVTSLEPAAVVDAYATAKVLSSVAPALDLGIVVNGVRSNEEANLAFRQIEIAATRFLTRSLKYYGFIAEDALVREAVLLQQPVVEHSPQSSASRGYRALAAKLAGLGPTSGHTLDVEVALEAEEITRCA
ncbi:MAG: MinD/ParA family protein [Vicinamibacterales bacterium]